MKEQSLLGVPLSDQSIKSHKVSFEDKAAKDWAWLKEWIDYYADGSYMYDTQIDVEKTLLNYRLWNGRGIYKTDITSPFSSRELEEEGFYFNGEDIPHFDILIPIGKSLHGQQQMTNLKPIVTDSSVTNVNFKKKKRIELYQRWIQDSQLKPLEDQAFQEWLTENNITDPSQLAPELQERMQQEISQKTAAMTPEDADKYMKKDYKSPRESLLQQITEFVLRRDKIKYWTDENFKHMLISGVQLYETGIKNNKAYFRILNPIGYKSGGPESAHFEEDMDWQVYTEKITLATLFKEHGHELTEKDLKKLKNFDVDNAYYRQRGEFPEPMASKIAEFDMETNLFDKAPHWSSREGQAFLTELHTKFGNISNGEGLFERTTVVFKSLRKFKLVERYDPEKQKFVEFWVDGSYTKNPKKDFSVKTVWFPHAYMGRRVDFGGADDTFYFDLGPVPNQYKNVLEPWNITMPIMGSKYSKLFNNTPNIAPIDLAKPWQDKFNIKLAMIQEKESTDIGRIFAISDSLKPKDWSFGKWLMMARHGKLLPLDTSNEALNGIDGQMFKEFNLSQLQDLAAHLQHLDWIRAQAALAMSYNPQRLGQIVATEAVRNAQGNIQQSTYQTQDLFTLHNEVVERLLNRHIWNEKIALRENEYVASYVLDDMSIADLTLDKESLDDAEIGITIRNSSEDYNKLELIKSLGQAMIQNQMITFPELIRLYMTNNMADAINVAEAAEEKMQKRQEQAQAAQAEQAQQIEKMKAEMKQMEQQFLSSEKALDRESREYTEKLRSMTMANQMDIDQDGQSDLIKIKEMDSTEKDKDRQLEERIADQKIKADLEKARIAARSKNNNN